MAKQVAIFASGSGSNAENIIKHFENNPDVNIKLVLCNKKDAFVLTRAKNLGIPSIVFSKKEMEEGNVLEILRKEQIDFIVLAGFLLMIPSFLVRAYDRRMINLHPALLPKFGGKGMYGHHVHEAVKAAGETETGMTVHWVSNVCDGGEIIAQFKTAISPEDTPEDIAEKEHVLEMEHFPKVIEKIINEG